MQIKRQGYTITGRSICIKGYSEGNSYNFHGTFKNLILTCTYQIDDSRGIERGATGLMLLNDGKTLKGYITFYDDKSSSTLSTVCEWTAEEAVGK
jgi:hypothetical protein